MLKSDKCYRKRKEYVGSGGYYESGGNLILGRMAKGRGWVHGEETFE